MFYADTLVQALIQHTHTDDLQDPYHPVALARTIAASGFVGESKVLFIAGGVDR